MTLVAEDSIAYSTVAIIATRESITHTKMLATRMMNKCATMIPTTTTIHTPAMSTTINGIEMWTAKIEVITMWVASIYTEMPETSLPI
jgi:hypothetical protein